MTLTHSGEYRSPLIPEMFRATDGLELRMLRRPGPVRCMEVRRTIFAILLTLNCGVTVAQGDLPLQIAAGSRVQTSSLLVLVDGQIISGHITPRPDGYDVQDDVGRIYIDSNRVRFEATNLPDAYDRMRDSIPEFTPTNHLELARWCLANQLFSQARREVLDALHLDPNREDAKRMLRALERLGENSVVPQTGSGFTEYPSLAQMQRPKIESRSLAGLSQSIAHSFVRDVQPLLMNKCANSGCHGNNTKTDFQLVSTHRGSTPALAEQNLAAVLKQVDFSRPATSPLLTIGGQAHADLSSSVFRGRSGSFQMQKLQQWVMQAAEDIAPQEVSVVKSSVNRKTGPVEPAIQRVSAFSDSSDLQTSRTIRQISENPHSRELTTNDTDDRFLQEARFANRQDAFSPDEFNRRFHGSSKNPSSLQSAASMRNSEVPGKQHSDSQIP